MASSKDDQLQVQTMNCPFARKAGGLIVVAAAINMHGTRIVVTNSTMFVNGTRVTEDTKTLLLGLHVHGDMFSTGMYIWNADRTIIVKVKAYRKKWASPHFYLDVEVEMAPGLADKSRGMCGENGSPTYDHELSRDKLLFDANVLTEVCSHCTALPQQCQSDFVSVAEAPVTTEMALDVHVCDDPELKHAGKCFDDPRDQAMQWCGHIEEDDARDACVEEFCLAGCDETIVRDDEEQAVETVFGIPDNVGPPIIPGEAEARSSQELTACLEGGVLFLGRCWYLSKPGADCGDACEEHALEFEMPVAPDGTSVLPTLVGKEPAQKEHPWAALECYAKDGDRYHPADPDGVGSDDPGRFHSETCSLVCPCV
jgi:hypothetical protein